MLVNLCQSAFWKVNRAQIDSVGSRQAMAEIQEEVDVAAEPQEEVDVAVDPRRRWT